ncbi:LysR family transcriptional regulator [Pseudorhodoferax sp.]|uniref:LysR family transcriptional regulator n=1 Tax=Pseudorhodoferax sp. TaxID=1993553 RepID=UPI0039E71005
MELRHLRYFMAVAEELHFTRAADRLNIEQAPVSRTIKDLEERLGARLFYRNHHHTRLTPEGEAFKRDVPRVFEALEKAIEGVRAMASGHRGLLRVAVSDNAFHPRLAALLALSREEEPDVEIHMSEVSLTQQLHGLRDDLFDAGLAHTGDMGDEIEAHPVWHDALAVAVPLRHPLLAFSSVPLKELLHQPLVLCHPQFCEGCHRELDCVLSQMKATPTVVDEARSLGMMLTLVAAGYGVGFVPMEQIEACHHAGVVLRPLDLEDATLTTYLLVRADREPSARLLQFIERAKRGLEPTE